MKSTIKQFVFLFIVIIVIIQSLFFFFGGFSLLVKIVGALLLAYTVFDVLHDNHTRKKNDMTD